MKKWAASSITIGAFATSLYLILSTGCNWQGGAGASDPNPAYNFVNFSGDYRGAGGGPIVINDLASYTNGTSTTTTAATSGTTHSGTALATANGSNQNTIQLNPNVVPNSVYIFVDSLLFDDVIDDGNGNMVTEFSHVHVGTISYATGAIFLTQTELGSPYPSGTQLEVSYDYISGGTSGSSSTTYAHPASGVTGPEVFSFVIEQFGNDVSMTDNNGATYKGTLGDIRGTGGNSELTSQTSTNFYATPGDQFIANFTANGKSAAGLKVKIVGVFQSTVITGGKTFTLGNLTIGGTWIESGGVTGDISGSSGATYTISFSTSNSGTNQASSSSSTTGG